MRTALAVLLLAGLLAEAAQAQHWCAINNEGARDCGFASLAGCREAISGMGGSCMPAAPVGHAQPGTNKRASAQDPKLDALIDRLNRKDDAMRICRGC